MSMYLLIIPAILAYMSVALIKSTKRLIKGDY